MSFKEIAHNWNPPDRLGYSSLRPVRLSRLGMILAVVIALFAIGGVVLGVVLATKSRQEALERDMLREQGVVTDATVLRVWRNGGKENTPRVRYRFEVQGRELVASHSVPKAIWDTLQAGSSIPVRYVPAQPAINHPAEWNVRVMPWFVSVLVAAMFLVMTSVMSLLIRGQWRLLAEGRPAPGIVTGYKKTDKAVAMEYEFRLLSGALKKGRGGAASSTKKLPPVGSVVCILYEPDNPRRNGLYPLQLVRLAIN